MDAAERLRRWEDCATVLRGWIGRRVAMRGTMIICGMSISVRVSCRRWTDAGKRCCAHLPFLLVAQALQSRASRAQGPSARQSKCITAGPGSDKVQEADPSPEGPSTFWCESECVYNVRTNYSTPFASIKRLPLGIIRNRHRTAMPTTPTYRVERRSFMKNG